MDVIFGVIDFKFVIFRIFILIVQIPSIKHSSYCLIHQIMTRCPDRVGIQIFKNLQKMKCWLWFGYVTCWELGVGCKLKLKSSLSWTDMSHLYVKRNVNGPTS